MNVRIRKGSATSTAVAVLAVLIVGGVIWYFSSDVFHTKVDSALKQGTTWTPENIAKDPKSYLDYVETQTKNALQSLQASKIAVAQNRAKLEGMRKDAQDQVSTGNSAITQLLAQYKTADAANVWPVTFNGQAYDKDKLKLQVVSLSNQVKTQQDLLTKVTNGLSSLDAQDGKIDQAQADAKNQLAQVTTNRELLNVNSLTADLKDKLVTMNATMASVVDAASNNNGTVSLEQLTAQSAAKADDGAFDKILANQK